MYAMKKVMFTNIMEAGLLLQRPTNLTSRNVEKQVAEIIKTIKNQGQNALLKYTQQYDCPAINNLVLSNEQIKQQAAKTPALLQKALKQAYKNIYKFHNAQKASIKKIETMPGITCWQNWLPIKSVGIYVPGGTAPLFSTLLMLAIPARIAACPQIVLCTPPTKEANIEPAMAFAAQLCGITKIYLCGGAQAIAAMALGNTIVPKVYKIFGPGNQYVTMAKQLLQTNQVAIDMPAGPSEVCVIADEKANPIFVAADLLAQAEHGPDSQVVCITNSKTMAKKIEEQLQKQLPLLFRKSIATKALQNSIMVVVPNVAKAIELSNLYAPEHLILQVQKANYWAKQVQQAGSVFIGASSPESVGDYATGTNHVLPTGGWANMYSGISLQSFCKKISYQQLTPKGLKKIAPTVVEMANAEGLQAHARAVQLRINNKKVK
jgi:histidinol dehydrogenase